MRCLRYIVRQGAAFHVIAIIIGLGLLTALVWADPRRSAIAITQAYVVFGPWEGPVLAGLFAAACILHELAHGFAGRRVGGGPVRYGTRFVLRVVPLAFYCALDGTMTRAGVVVVLLAPQVAVPAALGALALAAPQARGLCWLVFVLMLVGSVPDLLMLVAILGSRAAKVRDTAAGVIEVPIGGG